MDETLIKAVFTAKDSFDTEVDTKEIKDVSFTLKGVLVRIKVVKRAGLDKFLEELA